MLVSVGKTVQEPGWIYHWMEEGKLRVQNTFLITLNKIYYIVYVSYFIYRGRDEKKKRQEFQDFFSFWVKNFTRNNTKVKNCVSLPVGPIKKTIIFLLKFQFRRILVL